MRRILLLITIASRCWAQVGSLDTNFQAEANFPNTNDYTFSVRADHEGRFVIAGGFTSINGTNRARVARLNRDGTLDESFDPGPGPLGVEDPALIRSLDIQPDGKILIAGWFTNVNGWGTRQVARLNADGSVDRSFICNPGPSSSLNAVAVGPDGKIYIGGGFTELLGYNVQHVGRLHTNGHGDFSFWNTWNLTAPLALAVQRDGKVVAAGYPRRLDIPAVVRFNTNGSQDTSFSGPGNISVGALAIDDQNRILIGGDFEYVNGTRRPKLARLNPDGSLDASFNPPITDWVVFNWPWTITRATDRKWLVGGIFTKAGGFPGNYLFRMNEDGSTDETFERENGPNFYVRSAATQSDGRVIIGGHFTAVGGVPRSRIARLWGDPHLETKAITNAAVEISWPSVYTNYVLQSVSTLPGAEWIAATNAPVLASNRWVMTNTVTNQSRFFRLVNE